MIALVNAGPGTGKSRTIVQSYLNLIGYPALTPSEEQAEVYDYVKTELPRNASTCFFAYHNTSKDTLLQRVGQHAQVFTFHGAGMSNIIKKFGYQKLVGNRTERHIETLFGADLRLLPFEQKRRWYAIKRILHYLKIEALEATEENLAYIQMKYPDLSSYKIPDDWQETTEELLAHSLLPDGEVEFADMVTMGKRALTRPRFKFGLVDESQDISRSTYQLVTRMCEIVLFVGDKNQAIGAYAGASEEMYDSVASKSDAIFPMKTTFRCPPLICDLANQTRPGGVLVGPNKEDGDVKVINRNDLLKMNLPPERCLFVCRTNAGIISLALFLHSKDMSMEVLDKDLGDELIKYIKGFKVKELSELSRKLQMSENFARKSKNPIWIAVVLDKITPIREMMEKARTMDELFGLIKEIFRPKENALKGTTIHKAKGMEAENVFVINPPIPLQCCMEHPIQREQEINLKFVAITRSMRNLYWVKP